jgi:tetratricopeptide (TPR) repeat protein
MKDRSTSVKALAEFVRRNPEDDFSKFALALEMLKRDMPDKALVLFESIHRSRPDYPGLAYHLGKLYQRLGRLDEAADLFMNGIEEAQRRMDQHTLGELQAAWHELEFQRGMDE